MPLFLAGIIFSMFFAGTAMSATFEVDTPAGGFTVLGTCDPLVINDCSLEDAIVLANKDAIEDDIIFNMVGFFPFWTINISAPLVITEPVTIDGYNGPWTAQPNTVPAPGLTDAVLSITIDGSGLKAGESCFDLNLAVPADPANDFITIKGFVINNCPDNGISIAGENSVIQGNYIGTDRLGLAAVPNGGHGIFMSRASYCQIGGENPEDRNVISGNTLSGIRAMDGVNGVAIAGNLVGLDKTGNAALGNGEFGIRIGDHKLGTMSGNIIGNNGSDVGNGKRNFVAGNGFDGIYVSGAIVTRVFGFVQVRNNFMGTDLSGTVAIPNTRDGLLMVAAQGVQVEENLISGNTGNGISVNGDDGAFPMNPSSLLRIYSNKIGTDAAGTAPLGNGGAGVLLHNGTVNCFIGEATIAGSGNLIAHNTGAGIVILEENVLFPTSDNEVSMNAIYGNGSIGIDLASDGVTANDLNDADTGVNYLQNFPVIESVSYAGGNTTINASLHSEPSKLNYTVEFFTNDAADPSGYGEGQTYLGAVTGVNLDVGGNASIPFVVAGDYSGKHITATATDNTHNTSEFGPMTAVDLSITKTAGAATANQRDNVTFSVTVSNTAGPVGASGVKVTDLVGGGFTYVSNSVTAGTYNSVTGVWDVGNLAFGASETLTINTYVNSCGNLANTASITGGPFDSVTADNTATATVTVACPPIAGGRPEGGSTGTSWNDSSDTDLPASDRDKNTEADPSVDSAESESTDEETDNTFVPLPESSPKYCHNYIFSPENASAVNRYELTKMMMELTCHQLPADMPEGEKSFTDYPRKTYDNESLNGMVAAMYYANDVGIIGGYPDGTLRPFEPVNFAEASKIVYMSMNVTEEQYTSAFSRLTFNFFGTEWYVKYYIFLLDLTGWTEINPAETLTATDAQKITDYLLEKYPV